MEKTLLMIVAAMMFVTSCGSKTSTTEKDMNTLSFNQELAAEEVGSHVFVAPQHHALKTPSRSNQKNAKPFPTIFRKVRKRIETNFSQLCDQFLFIRNYAKNVDGLFTRIIW